MLVAALVARLEIYFAKLLITVIHEMDFKTSTTYHFTCLIFHLWRNARVPLWHCDTLCSLAGTVDTVLIKDEANVEAPRREPEFSCSC